MPCMLLLMWLASAIALWACVIWGFREVFAETDDDRSAMVSMALVLAAGPPTLVFLVSAYVLLQAAPTVQFNAGNSRAMDLWSFWVEWWPALFGCSGLQTGCYLLWLLGSFVTKTRPCVRCAVGLGLLTSVWGSLLLRTAYPTA